MNPFSKMTASQILAHVTANGTNDDDEVSAALARLSDIAKTEELWVAWALLRVLADEPAEIAALRVDELRVLTEKLGTATGQGLIFSVAALVLDTVAT